MKNRTILGICCLVIAIAVCFIIAPMVNNGATDTTGIPCADCEIRNAELTVNSNSAEDILKTLDGSKQAISIAISNFASGLSGKLKNGDIVSIIVTNEGNTYIPPELKYVRVITTTSAKGEDVGEGEDSDQPKTITLLVNEKQATILAKHEISGKLHISLAYRGDSATAAKFLSAQEAVFK